MDIDMDVDYRPEEEAAILQSEQLRQVSTCHIVFRPLHIALTSIC
jgi:hypothetical protein